MKKFSEKTDLCQISLTGTRAIILLGLLMSEPRSLEEIKQIFVDAKLMEDSASDDILRIDMNTLKAVGCEISRASASTQHKHILSKHPFMINLSKSELALIKKAYKKSKPDMSVETLVKYDELFRKLANSMPDGEAKEYLLGLSSLKIYDKKLIKNLLQDCELNNTLNLTYKPSTSEEREMVIYAQKLLFQNEKLYLLGKDFTSGEEVMLNIKRILQINSRSKSDDDIETKSTKIKFLLKSFGVAGMSKDETILETTPDGYIIEGNYHNEFIAKQRILSFGSSCTVLEPDGFKHEIISKLKSMKDIYND